MACKQIRRCSNTGKITCEDICPRKRKGEMNIYELFSYIYPYSLRGKKDKKTLKISEIEVWWMDEKIWIEQPILFRVSHCQKIFIIKDLRERVRKADSLFLYCYAKIDIDGDGKYIIPEKGWKKINAEMGTYSI